MQIQIKYFGLLEEFTGKEEEIMEIPKGVLLNELILILEERYPGFSSQYARIAVDGTIVSENLSLQQGNTLAIMPPFAGG